MTSENSTATPRCTQCSLLNSSPSSSQSHITTQDMYHITTFLVPGVFFCLLSVRWSVLLLYKWSKAAQFQQLQLAGLPLPPAPGPAGHGWCLQQVGDRQLPWEGLVKIVLAAFATVLTVYLPSLSPSSIIIISMYVFFLISGIVDVLVFYCGYLVLPEGIQSFILAASFSIEAICFHSLANEDTSRFILLLIFVILCCSISSILEVIFDNRLIKFCRTFFTLLQSSWLLHLSVLLSQDKPVSPLWATILFTWHLATLFLLFLLLLLLFSHCSKPVPSPPLLPSSRISQVSPSGSSSQLVPCKFLQLPLRPPNHESMSPSNTNTMFQAMYKADQVMTMRAPSVVDVEPWDRVHRIQYTTFQNNR